MAIGFRRALVWATVAAAVVSAVLLAGSGGSLQRADAAARPGAAGLAPAAPAH